MTGTTITKLRRPCENCPWRVDAPRGYWDPQHFVDIFRNCQDDGLNIMLCHKSRTTSVRSLTKCLSGGVTLYAQIKNTERPITVKDLVRLNPRTVKLWNGERWTQVVGWTKSKHAAKRIAITLRSGETLACTGDHQWPTTRGTVQAADLVVGDVVHMCTLPEPGTPRVPGYLTDDLCWLIGLWAAEGSTSGSTMQLSLNRDEARWLPRIRAAVEQLGGSMTHKIFRQSLAVYMNGSVLRAALDSYCGGETAHNVHFTSAVWMLPNVQLRLIAEGYFDGDGHFDRNSDRIRLTFCRNRYLARDLRIFAARLGATITLTPAITKYQLGTRPIFRGQWRWRRSGHSSEKDRGEIIDIRPSNGRTFWDVSVKDDPHLFATASGVLTHNCDAESPNLSNEKCREIPCQGWIRVMGFDAIGVRILVMRNQVTMEEVEDTAGPDLFPTFTAMLRANKIRLPKRSQKVPVDRTRTRR